MPEAYAVDAFVDESFDTQPDIYLEGGDHRLGHRQLLDGTVAGKSTRLPAGAWLEVTLPVGGPSNLTELYEEHYNFGGEHNTLYTRLRDAALSSLASSSYTPSAVG